MRFTIDEYANQFKMSKEMIHSRLKNKRLNYIIENGTTYIIVPRSSLSQERKQELSEQQASPETPKAPPPAKPKTTVGTIIALYQRENTQLKQRIKELEAKIDRLVDDKERMLIDERNRIEQVYSAKDEQLKSILELINHKLLLSQERPTVHDVELDDDPAEKVMWQNRDFVPLREYLNTLDMKSSQRKTIRKRFADAYGQDVRILQQNGELYLDFSKYDYSDLFSL